MSKTIRVITRTPGLGQEPQTVTVEAGYKTMQRLVTPEGEDSGRSMIECVYIPELSESGVDLWVNEEGKLIGLKPNFMIFDGQDVAVGPIFFASSDEEGETVGLTDEQVEKTLAWLANQPKAVLL